MKTILLCVALFALEAALGSEPTNSPTVRTNRSVSGKEAAQVLSRLDREYSGLVRQLTNALASAQSRTAQKNRAAFANFQREAELDERRNGPRISSSGAPVYRAPFSVEDDPTVKSIRAQILANRNHSAHLRQAVADAYNNDPKVVSEKQAKRDEAVKKFRAEQAAKGETEK